MMKGYRTIIAMALALGFSVLQSQGIGVPEDDQAAIQAGIVAIVALILRFVTKTPVGGGK